MFCNLIEKVLSFVVHDFLLNRGINLNLINNIIFKLIVLRIFQTFINLS